MRPSLTPSSKCFLCVLYKLFYINEMLQQRWKVEGIISNKNSSREENGNLHVFNIILREMYHFS